MEVWVMTSRDRVTGEDDFEGVFSTKEIAEEAKKEIAGQTVYRNTNLHIHRELVDNRAASNNKFEPTRE